MNKKAYDKSQQYFKKVFEFLNKDRKYVSEASKIKDLEEVNSDLNTDLHPYEITCKLQLVNDDIREMSPIQVERRLKNHFGELFSILDGGSRNIKVKSIENGVCIAKIRYVSEEKIFR